MVVFLFIKFVALGNDKLHVVQGVSSSLEYGSITGLFMAISDPHTLLNDLMIFFRNGLQRIFPCPPIHVFNP
jgi:hypothetical protein